MPQQLLHDLENIDLDRKAFDSDAIQAINPQRFEFLQLDHIAHFSAEEEIAIAVRDLRDDEFWTRGHMPGQPIFPGVLMLEAGAQLCSFYVNKCMTLESVFGFGGADNVRFRRMVVPGDRLVLLARPKTISQRRSLFQVQGLLDGQIAFEASIMGIALPVRKQITDA